MKIKIVFLQLVLLVSVALSAAVKDVPKQMFGHHYVQDYAQVFTSSEANDLEYRLAMIEDSASVQIAVVSVTEVPLTTDIDTYATDIFTEWGIGHKGKDDGLLILFAVNSREVVMRTGYGTEAVLTDALCSQIIRHKIAPEFAEKNYYKGVADAVDDVSAIVRGEFTPEQLGYTSSGEEGLSKEAIAVILILVFVVPLFLPKRYRSTYYMFLFQILLSALRGGKGGGGRSYGGGRTGGGGSRGSW